MEVAILPFGEIAPSETQPVDRTVQSYIISSKTGTYDWSRWKAQTYNREKVDYYFDKFLVSINDSLEDEELFYELPSKKSLAVTKELLTKSLEIDLLPFRVVASKDGGIAVYYSNNGNRIVFEIDNDGDLAYLKSHQTNKSIIQDIDIKDVSNLIFQ